LTVQWCTQAHLLSQPDSSGFEMALAGARRAVPGGGRPGFRFHKYPDRLAIMRTKSARYSQHSVTD